MVRPFAKRPYFPGTLSTVGSGLAVRFPQATHLGFFSTEVYVLQDYDSIILYLICLPLDSEIVTISNYF